MPIQIGICNAIGAGGNLVGGGPGPGPGYTPPLDAYPADIAYSVRKLSSSYTGPAIEVERNPGGETQDIYFDSNGLVDTTALATFAAGAELRVKTFYDQTGNGRHATTTVSTDMSYIYSGTAVYETNEIPVITPRGLTDGFYPITGTYSTAANNTVFAVLSAGFTNGSYLMARPPSGGPGILMGAIATPTSGSQSAPDYGFGTTQYYRDGAYYGGTGTGLTRDDFAQSSISSQRIYGVGFTQSALTSLTMGRAGNTSIYATQEYIVYFSDQLGTTPRQSLEQNLNSYYRSSNLPDYTSGFLADYPDAAVAYSVRQLSNTAIKCMRVRRFVPPYDEQDIGFTAGGDLDEAAIVAFGGSDELRVSAWYDQSGQSRHATQINPNSQPQIYNGTAVITRSGQASIYISTSAAIRSTTGSMTQPNSTFACADFIFGKPIDASLGRRNYEIKNGGNFALWAGTAPFTATTGGGWSGTSNLQLVSTILDGVSTKHKLNNRTPQTCAAGTLGSTGYYFGGQNGTLNAELYLSEFIAYESDETIDQSNIVDNQNTYYDIYTVYNPDPATSGFLFDYPNASTAYSVRQLNNTATVSMRVMRAVAPFDEQDIGFVNGDLDEAAIVAFGGSDALTVSAWYDQSGNQNHARQIGPNQQPQIYDGASVIDQNGKPGVDFYNTTDRYLQYTLISPTDYTVSYVGTLNGNSRNSIVGLRSTGSSNTEFIRTSFLKINVLSSGGSFQSGYGTIASGLNPYSIIVSSASSTATVYRNNTSIASSIQTPSLKTDTIGGTDTGDAGIHSEIVIWESELNSSDRAAVYSNQDTYYNIP